MSMFDLVLQQAIDEYDGKPTRVGWYTIDGVRYPIVKMEGARIGTYYLVWFEPGNPDEMDELDGSVKWSTSTNLAPYQK